MILKVEAQTNVQMCSSERVREGIQIFDNFIINALVFIICYILSLAIQGRKILSTTLPRVSGLCSLDLYPFPHNLTLREDSRGNEGVEENYQ